MSSHHIVREKQEPALLVLGFGNFDDELLGQLLEWSPTVIATAATAERLHAYGIKIDWIIADGIHQFEQSDVQVLPAGGADVAAAALKYLVEKQYPSVNIITDEPDLSLYAPYAGRLNLVIFNGRRKIYPINSGFSKWKPSGEIIEICGTAEGFASTGLAEVSGNVYKTTGDGIISLQFNAPFLFIAEEI